MVLFSFMQPVVFVCESAFEPDMALSSCVSACRFEVKGGRQVSIVEKQKLERFPTDTKSIRKRKGRSPDR